MFSKVSTLLYYLFVYPYYKIALKRMGARTRIFSPLKIQGPERISLGNRVVINEQVWLAAIALTGDNDCGISIGDGCYLGHFNHIYATSRITIGKKVMTADKVYISDNRHGYENPELPVIDQPIVQLRKVHIGDGSWIGENACILGASMGKGCVLGANSVLLTDLPDYCVAGGVPAKIIKRYSAEQKSWLRTDAKGNFLLK